jgi:hypothetical protein
MFHKLKSNLVVSDYKPLEETISYGEHINGKFMGISYNFVEFNNSDLLYSLVPLKYRHNFYTQVMKINTPVPPHTDSGIGFTINCYLQTDNCLTQFYKLNTDAPQTTKMVMQTTGKMYREEDLDKTKNFIAKSNEMWILDVSKPHSVTPLGEFKERVAITLSSMKYSYDEVCNMLYETGNL